MAVPYIFSPTTVIESSQVNDNNAYILSLILSSFSTGSISMYAGSSAPTGYLLCKGQAVSRSTYSALFAVISTTYGTGDGSTTFNVPNLQGKVPVGVSDSDSDFDRADTGGAKTHTLTTDEMPSHSHGDTYATASTAIAEKQALSGNPRYAWNTLGSIPNAGGGAAHNNLQPYLTLNFIIKT